MEFGTISPTVRKLIQKRWLDYMREHSFIFKVLPEKEALRFWRDVMEDVRENLGRNYDNKRSR